MSTRLLCSLLLLVVSAPVVADDQGKTISRKIDGLMAPLSKGGFSGCVLVEQEGKVIHRKGYGITDLKSKTRIAPTMRFDIGSITKPMVSLAVLELAKQRTLTLDTPISKVLKNVPQDKQNITIEQLLSHTGGISKNYEFSGNVNDRDAVVAELLKIKLDASPGEKHVYSNANYFLLAAIIDAVDNRGYDETIRQLVFTPLKMTTATFSSDPPLKDEKVPARFESRAPLGPMVPWPHGWAHRGATGVVCSVDDLLAFSRALDEKSPIAKNERDEWLKVRKESAALGWSVISKPGRPTAVIHGGASPGAKGLLVCYPEKKVTVVVLSNHVTPGKLDEWTIANSVRDWLFGQ
ncbi:MAG TPA: serine hydrolase domain-containing protein [Caulifigura sp.]|nr:serine hydrolase domain-containing protein [Caulifigura sp.]